MDTTVFWLTLAVVIVGTAVMLGMLRLLIHEFLKFSHDRRVAVHQDMEADLTALPYVQRTSLLSEQGRHSWALLTRAVPSGYMAFVQVSLSAVVAVDEEPGRWWSYADRIRRHSVDFVVCEEQNLRPRLVILMTDASHRAVSSHEQFNFISDVLAAAAVPVLHIEGQHAEQVTDLAARIRAKLEASSAPYPVEATQE